MSSLLPGGCPPSPAVTLRLPPVMLHPPLPRGSRQGPFLPRKPAAAVPVPHGAPSGLGAAHKCCELAGLSCWHLRWQRSARGREG